jgi:leader peptidase (prepilin peptidase)/N-methyltransferase
MEDRMLAGLTEVIWLILVFLLGAAVGSYLNVVVGRLPLEKSLLWPSSHCLTCLRKLSMWDNLPIIGWLRRRGQCRYCGTHFSSRYLWVELFTGLVFALIFFLDVIQNWHRIPFFETNAYQVRLGVIPWQGWILFLHHAILASLLIAASLCDFDHRAIPITLTSTGTVIGLLMATLWAWPFPNDPAQVAQIHQVDSWAFGLSPDQLIRGVYPWPVWGPLPNFLANHSWIQGLLTGLAGAAMGMFLVRTVKFLFEQGLGKEALGLGDADLMMMAGAFVGWQITLVSFFMGAVVSIPLGGYFVMRHKDRSLPFGPGLALGVLITLFAWPWIAPFVQPSFFDPFLIATMAFLIVGGMFVGSIALRLLGYGRK